MRKHEELYTRCVHPLSPSCLPRTGTVLIRIRKRHVQNCSQFRHDGYARAQRSVHALLRVPFATELSPKCSKSLVI